MKTAAVLTEGRKPNAAGKDSIVEPAGRMVETNKMKINRDKYKRCIQGGGGQGEGEGGK